LNLVDASVRKPNSHVALHIWTTHLTHILAQGEVVHVCFAFRHEGDTAGVTERRNETEGNWIGFWAIVVACATHDHWG
jgi:hypothetical protein